ncbi:DUF2334 domain-containing protein [Paraliobacillus salinarum]|uniref:DUF2334 domain-containing protein n=1 Tax=Paraliobacillus salinarum TaxID=1158996 RepID=UPI0015F5B89F|nr:DUF2334 domain-containing protein [Paraliobacillus salinarum]
MKRNRIAAIFLFVFIFFSIEEISVVAQDTTETNILVVYSADREVIDIEKNLLDLLLAHFTSEITWIESDQLKREDLNDTTHAFYYGITKKTVPKKTIDLLESFQGPFVVIGHNVENFDGRFSYSTDKQVVYASFIQSNPTQAEKVKVEDLPVILYKTEELDKSKIILSANLDQQTAPLLVKEKNNYYYATTNLFSPASYLFADFLHDLFETHQHSNQKAYIRIEDIHPRSDPTRLKAVATILAKADIPYMVSVTPVYTNPKTRDTFSLWESPELVNALQEMQSQGGSIVLHGYTDQSEQGQTGSGFEFWNKKDNRPITQINEKDYMTEKIEQGVQDLVDNGLYPLAFEVPHYAMSAEGYEILSKHFSTIVGQVQLTDRNWRKMSAPPYITKPNLLQGMLLIPETAGYITYDDPAQSIEVIKERIDHIQMVRDGVLGVFYHPFMGDDLLYELIRELDGIEKENWIDLKREKHEVTTDLFHITSSKGEIDVNQMNKTLAASTNQEKSKMKTTTFKLGLIIGAILLLGLILFSILRLKRLD